MLQSDAEMICDICDNVVKSAKKEDGIWICPSCEKKYPKAETETNNRMEKSC